MSRSVDTLYRQWLMLSKIPRYPRSISAPALKSILEDEGYKIDIRTIQRDLLKLSSPFPLSNETEGRKNYWFWMEHAAVQDLPGMEPVTALAFEMAESYLTPLLPKATLDLLQPYFYRAKEVLQTTSAKLKDWPKKVAVIDRGPVLIKPTIEPLVQNIIYQALLEEKQLQVTYKPRHSKNLSKYTVHPLGIVSRHSVIYLICTLWDYHDVKQLALHRFESATLLSEKANLVKQFNLNDYVKKDHQFSYPLNLEPIKLKALFKADIAEHLYETPLTINQTLTVADDSHVLLEATLIDTLDLRWWLSGFGSNVEIIEPINLREYFIAEAQLLIDKYLD